MTKKAHLTARMIAFFDNVTREVIAMDAMPVPSLKWRYRMPQHDVELHMIGIHMADVMRDNLDDHIMDIAKRMGVRGVLCKFELSGQPYYGVGVLEEKDLVELRLMFG